MSASDETGCNLSNRDGNSSSGSSRHADHNRRSTPLSLDTVAPIEAMSTPRATNRPNDIRLATISSSTGKRSITRQGPGGPDPVPDQRIVGPSANSQHDN